MKSTIFIPDKINVGYQERSSTYTGKLAYVIYFDEKGKLRKEASWNSWRNKDIDNDIYENVPLEGFVLNKKVGDYSSGWNHRQAYVRIYDPRNFEFEITIENLLYILENTNSIKGKGLEGQFVYGWDGKDLVLIPTSSPDYIEISEYNKKLHSKVKLKGKDLKLGGTYLTKDNVQLVYLGRFDEWDYDYIYEEVKGSYGISGRRWTGKYDWKVKRKAYFFINPISGSIKTIQSLSKDLIDVVSEVCVENYAELFDILECSNLYSPVDDAKDEYVDYTFEEFKEKAENSWWGLKFIIDNNGTEKEIKYDKRQDYAQGMYESTMEEYMDNSGWRPVTKYKQNKKQFNSLEEVYDFYKPKYLRKYLANGKLYREEK